VELGRKLCALCEGYCSNSNLHTVHTAYDPAPHNQCRTPYAVVHDLVLLMMGIMVPETCWDRSLIINTRLAASYWFLFLHPTFMMHGHKNLKFFHFTIQRLFLILLHSSSLYSLPVVHPPITHPFRYRGSSHWLILRSPFQNYLKLG